MDYDVFQPSPKIKRRIPNAQQTWCNWRPHENSPMRSSPTSSKISTNSRLIKGAILYSWSCIAMQDAPFSHHDPHPKPSMRWNSWDRHGCRYWSVTLCATFKCEFGALSQSLSLPLFVPKCICIGPTFTFAHPYFHAWGTHIHNSILASITMARES